MNDVNQTDEQSVVDYEKGMIIDCEGAALVGILHRPAERSRSATVGVVIVVAGGPQYRVGAHRQFVTMARQLAAAGIPTLRFDHRGVGDSDGVFRGFVDMDADIRAAVDALCETQPQVKRVMLWGECESASAIAFYAFKDQRIAGLYMVNPWIRTEVGQAKTILRHYYWHRLTDRAFWQKLRSGKFSPRESLRSLTTILKTARRGAATTDAATRDALSSLPLPERLPRSLERFGEAVLIITSGRDFIAREFTDSARESPLWNSLRARSEVVFEEIADADHTFTRPEWRHDLYDRTLKWVLRTAGESSDPDGGLSR